MLVITDIIVDPRLLAAILIVAGIILRCASKYIDKIPLLKNKPKKNIEIQNEALRCILKTMITTMYMDSIRDGFINVYKLNCVELLYNSYKEFNGNSFIDNIMFEIRKLPIEKEE